MKAIFEDLHLSQSGRSFQFYEVNLPSFEPYWHYHPEYELTLITSGSGLRYVGDHIERFETGDLVLIGSNIPHQWVSDQKSPRCRAVVFHFDPSKLLSIHEIEDLTELFGQAKRGIRYQKSLEVSNLLENAAGYSRTKLLSILIEILDLLSIQVGELLVSENFRPYLNGNVTRMQHVNTFILENIAKKLTITRAAEVANLTEESFCRWFKKEAGTTFIKFVNMIRIENSCRLLLEGNKSINSIAYECGFDSISQFNRVFKNLKRTSPLRYRKLA